MRKYLLIILFISTILSDNYDGLTLITNMGGGGQGGGNQPKYSHLIDIDENIINSWEHNTSPASIAYLMPDSILYIPCKIGQGGGGQGFGDFSGGFSDIFEEFFGGGFGGGQRQRGPQRGNDLRYNMSVSLQEAFAGKKSQIRIPSYEGCDLCAATGSADKSGPSTCATCGGQGKVRSTQGFFSIERPCPTCAGEGSSIKNPCLKCSGTGQVKKQKTISVSIPAGVDTGTRIRISGEGEPGQKGAGNGDLYIFVEVQKDKLFEREDENIFCQIPISITTAIIGGDVEVPTIEGKKARLNIPAGTQSETQFRLKGKGMSILRQTRRGDMYVEANVEIPVNLTSKQKGILQEFEKEGGTSKKHSPKSQSFFSKLKEVWEDLT